MSPNVKSYYILSCSIVNIKIQTETKVHSYSGPSLNLKHAPASTLTPIKIDKKVFKNTLKKVNTKCRH